MGADMKMFLSKVNQIYNEKPSYRLGGYAKDGTCDCIGLCIGALYRCGISWGGTHGTNWAVRNAMDKGFSPITSIGQLKVGMWVYKGRKPGEAGYSLPDKYKSSGDLTDYYHVGVVTQVAPLQITHMTTPTTKIDTKMGKWKYGGFPLTKYVNADVDDGGDKPVDYDEVIVFAKNGGDVKLRQKPSTSCRIYWEVATGTVAERTDEADGWSFIKTADVSGRRREGWMMSKFLTKPSELGGIVNSNQADDPDTEVEELNDEALDYDDGGLEDDEKKIMVFEALSDIEKKIAEIYEILGGVG